MTDEYIQNLVSTYPSIREIWLLGSRANGRATPSSDWDYLVFTDDGNLLNALYLDKRFNLPDIDLLLVFDGIAVKPWEDRPDRLNLRLDVDLAWTELSATQARYLQAKKRSPSDLSDGVVHRQEAKAKLLYRRSGPLAALSLSPA